MDWKLSVLFVANRFKEPSSWAGLGALLALVGLNMTGVELGYLVNIGTGLCGLVAVLIPEKK